LFPEKREKDVTVTENTKSGAKGVIKAKGQLVTYEGEKAGSVELKGRYNKLEKGCAGLRMEGSQAFKKSLGGGGGPEVQRKWV